MSVGRHSYVRFFPSDWLAGTARMTRLHRSVYFDICCYNWDKGEPVPQSELALMVLDVENGSAIVAQLLAVGKIVKSDEGTYSPRAIEEAEYAFDQWERRSRGGKSYRPSLRKEHSSKIVPSLIVSNNQNQNQNQIEIASLSCQISTEVKAVIDGWNTTAKRVGIPQAKGKASAGRLKLIRQRLKDHGLEEILKALASIQPGGFIPTKWQPNLDSLFRAEKMTRLIEGGYGGPQSTYAMPF